MACAMPLHYEGTVVLRGQIYLTTIGIHGTLRDKVAINKEVKHERGLQFTLDIICRAAALVRKTLRAEKGVGLINGDQSWAITSA